MTDPGHLLIVEDDLFVQWLLAAYLGQVGYRVSVAESGEKMFDILEKEAVDLIILDLTLPDDDGLVLTRKLRTRWSMPIVVLTGRAGRDDRLTALELGADDYVVKPADPEELALRVRNLLRRTGGKPDSAGSHPDVIRFEEWELDIPRFRLSRAGGENVALSPAEFKLLTALVKADGRVLSRDQLLDAISGTDEAPGDRIVDVLVSRLRRKIEVDPKAPVLVLTVTGAGYKFGGRSLQS
ncbi:MAG: response regulator transcription factor [Magnetospirillum sp. WYHS-4]